MSSSSKGNPANVNGVDYGPPLGGKVEAPDVDSVHKQELVDEHSGESAVIGICNMMHWSVSTSQSKHLDLARVFQWHHMAP